VAAVNSLRAHGYWGPIAVADVGLHRWMVDYLANYDSLYVLDLGHLTRVTRFTDVLADHSPVMHAYAYKAFAIVHFRLFESFTFIDGDYLPLVNMERELRPLIESGKFVSTRDGTNCWTQQHAQAVGVVPGEYLNINAGFFSLSMRHFDWLLVEWRNLMTRRQPFELWFADQGALNLVLDKYGVPKTAFEQPLWNQTWLNQTMHDQDLVAPAEGPPRGLLYRPTGERIRGWHGWGWHKPWHYLGIDQYRRDAQEREAFRTECQRKIPPAAAAIFQHYLFLDGYNAPLRQNGWQIECC
jgi:hypothetical protein